MRGCIGLPLTLSGLTALLDADFARLCTFDLPARGKPLVTHYTQGSNFRSLAATFAVFEYLDIARAWPAIFVRAAFLGWQRSPKDEQFADVLYGSRVEFVCQRVKNGIPGGPVVRQDPDLDQAMGIQTGFDFVFYSGRQPTGANHDDRVKVVGLRALLFALRRSELDLGHAAIID